MGTKIEGGYFHPFVARRRQHNGIYQLKLDDGSKTEGNERIGLALTRYFTNLYKTQGVHNANLLLQHLSNLVTNEDNLRVGAKVTVGKIKEALSSMGNYKALGPDGYHACFYKHMWSNIHMEVHEFFLVFSTTQVFFQEN